MGLKSLLTKILVGLCLCISFPVCAEELKYIVVDNEVGLYETFDSFKAANNYYKNNVNAYSNLLLYEDNRLIKMEYGVVCFNANNNHIEYYSESKKQDDLICPSYGVDGAYLYTEDDDIYFVMAGDWGHTNIGNVTLIPYEQLKVKTSLYYCDDNYLYHNIKTQLDYEYYSSSLKIDFIPEYLDSNTSYYSYDGHYFYDDFYLMIDDYKDGSNNNAVNEVAYYNYYMYLPYRSMTNYDYKIMEDYFYKTLGMNARLNKYADLNMDSATDEINRSQFYGLIDDFYAYQNVYGANALMLISSAINESSYGKSNTSFINNNLYNTSAFDSSIETSTNRYNSVSNSIYSQAKYFVSNRYSNYNRDDYCGSFYGDRYSGITSTFCLDQYAGERLAASYFEIDNSLGLLDYNSYSIAVIDSSINIYNDRDLNDLNYRIKNNNQLAFIILNEFDDSYLIQLDYCGNGDYLYDYEDCTGYISKDKVSYIINEGTYNDSEFINVTYDFNGGNFVGLDSITIKTKKGSVPAYIEPINNGYEFIGYGTNLDCVYEDTTYVANYREIKEISIGYLLEKQVELYPSIDLSDAYIIVKYADGVNKKVAINSDMLSYIDTSLIGEQDLTVSYCGVSASKTITINEDVSLLYKEVTDALNNEDYQFIKDNISNILYPFTMSNIRNIDSALRQIDERNYVINDASKKYDISISGLDLALADKSSYSFFRDTYYVEVDDIKATSKEKILSLARGYGFDEVCGININFKFNFQNIDLNGPVIVQLNIDDKQANNIYTVYHINKNGDIIKSRTSHSDNYVQFIIGEEGDYLVLSKEGINEFNINDGVENLSYDNVGFDNHKFNLNVLFIAFLTLIGLIGIIIYYIIRNKKEYEWKDYRKSLQKADTVQEEKPKN